MRELLVDQSTKSKQSACGISITISTNVKVIPSCQTLLLTYILHALRLSW